MEKTEKLVSGIRRMLLRLLHFIGLTNLSQSEIDKYYEVSHSDQSWKNIVRSELAERNKNDQKLKKNFDLSGNTREKVDSNRNIPIDVSKIQPSPNRAKPPAFNDLDDKTFEELCCALLEREEKIVKADLYKMKYKKQYGVDIVGELEDEKGLYVVSCKVRQILKKEDIVNFGNEFLEHWENHWKDKNVKKFILAVTYSTNSDEREKDIKAEKDRFKEYDLIYEDWAPRMLQAKVRPHRGIASQYLGDQVAEQICGRDQPATAPTSDNQAFIDAAMSQQIVEIQNALSGKIDDQLEQVREQIRRKEVHKVDSVLAKIENDQAQWSSLSLETKAAVKRLMASRALHRNDVKLARKLCVDAENFDQSKTGTLKALIALSEGGPKDALKLLEKATTTDELKLRAGLYLSILDIKPAMANLKVLSKQEEDGEVLRLYSLAYLMKGDREQALSYILEAEKDYGDWFAVQKTAMVIRFHIFHSPCVPFHLSAWPNPNIPELVLENDEAQKYLEEGLLSLEKLIEIAKDDRQEQKDLQVWRLAYLSNFKIRSFEAELYANELLEGDETFAGVIIWSLARGYNFDFDKSKKSLEKLVSSDEAEIEQILCLIGILHFEENYSESTKLLEKTKDKFNTPQLEETWNHWYLRNNSENANLTEGEINIEDQLIYQTQLAVQNNDWAELANTLATANKKKLDVGNIFVACLNFARHDQWKMIEPYSSTLIEKIQTPDAIKIAAICAYNNGNMKDTLEILEQNIHVFANNKLSIDMRRLRKKAAIGEGNFTFALTEGEKLIAETNSIDDRLEHVNTLFSIGDVRGATSHIKGALDQGNLSSTTALQLSSTVQGVDPYLANKLFNTVQVNELPDEFVGPFLGQANKLGIDDDLHDLFGRMNSLSEQQPQLIQMVSMDDIIKFVQDRKKENLRVDEAYTQGNIPVHFISSFQGLSITELIFENFSETSDKTVSQKNKLLFRFAGRTQNLDIQLESTKLYLDITSLLVAYKLGILDLIEANVVSINIAPHLQKALIHAERDLQHPQPKRLTTMKEILSSLDNGNIKSAPGLTGKSLRHSYDVQGAFTILHDTDLAKEDLAIGVDAINIRQLVNCLQNMGSVTTKKIDELTSALPNYMKAAAIGDRLNKGDKLIFDYNTFELLASEKLLNSCTTNFDIYVDQRYIDDAKAEVNRAEFRDSIAKNVSQFREMLADKIRSGDYNVFPHSDMNDLKSQHEEVKTESELCLSEVLRLKEKKDSVVCVDDRYLNHFSNVNNNPLVDIYDILNLLCAQGTIDSDQFYDFLLFLRKANYYYIPVTTEEVVHHLKKQGPGTIQDCETDALKIVRQYISMLVLQEGFLAFNVEDQYAYDEKGLMSSTYLLAGKTILSLWSDASLTVETKREYSAWVWDSIRVERLTRIPVRQPNEEGYRHLYITSLSGLIVNVMQLPMDVYESYFQWLNDYIFQQLFRSNKRIVKEIAKYIGDLLLSLSDKRNKDISTDQELYQVRKYFSELVKKLPDEVQVEILKNRKYSGFLNLKRVNLVTIHSQQIIAQDFWRGIGKALKSGSTSIDSYDKKDTLSLSLILGNDVVPTFKIGKEGKYTTSDPLFSFLRSRNSDVLNAFNDNKDWFEYPKGTRKKIFKKIAGTKDLSKRAEIIELERMDAPAYKYAQLESHIASENSFNWTELEPAKTDRLINHMCLRLSKSKKIAVRIKKAAENLIAEDGPEVAFRYFAGLPIDIPEIIINSFRSMQLKTFNSSIENIYGLCHSPLRLFHFLNLVRSVKKNPRKNDQFKQAINILQNDGEKLCEAHISILRYFDKYFCIDHDWLALSTEERILVCWYHSDQISNLLIGYGVPLDDLAKEFQRRYVPDSSHFLLKDKDYRICPYASSNIYATKLFFDGMNMAVGSGNKSLLTQAERKAFTTNFSSGEGNTSVANPWILKNNSGYASPIKSYLTANGYDFGFLLGGEEFSKLLKTENVAPIIQELKENIEVNPNEFNYWLQIMVFYHAGLLPESAQVIFKKAPEIDFYSFFKSEGEFAAPILSYVTLCLNLYGDDELIEQYKKSLLKTIEQLSKNYKKLLDLSSRGKEDWVTCAATSLCDALLVLARRDGIEDTLNVVASTVLEVCMIWPSLSPIWRRTLNSIINDLGFKDAAPLWETQIKLRAME